MVRALATATPVAEALGLPLIAWTDIHERGGVYDLDFETRERVGKQGNGRTYLKNRFPLAKLPANLDDTGWWGNKPYETKEDASARAKRVWDYLLDKHAGTNDRVAIVSHGGFFHSIMEILLNVDTQPASPLVGNTWLRMNNVAISRFDVHDDFVAVSYVNRIGYLPTALMT